jgi:hypothetical protein
MNVGSRSRELDADDGDAGAGGGIGGIVRGGGVWARVMR